MWLTQVTGIAEQVFDAEAVRRQPFAMMPKAQHIGHVTTDGDPRVIRPEPERLVLPEAQKV